MERTPARRLDRSADVRVKEMPPTTFVGNGRTTRRSSTGTSSINTPQIASPACFHRNKVPAWSAEKALAEVSAGQVAERTTGAVGIGRESTLLASSSSSDMLEKEEGRAGRAQLPEGSP